MPDWKNEIRLRLSKLKLEPAREAAIIDELSQHLDDHFSELLASGMKHEDAYRQTLTQLGESELLTRELKPIEQVASREPLVLGTNRRTNLIADLAQDVRYGMRMLRKRPGFAVVALLSLALGIGATTLVFSLMRALLFTPPPGITAPDQVVGVTALNASSREALPLSIPYPDSQYYRHHNVSFSGLASHSAARPAETYLAAEVQAEIVSDNFFSVLDVHPLLGRFFLPEEDEVPGRNPVVVLSHSFWQKRFQGDERAIGQQLKLNGVSFTVVGVAPPAFRGGWVGLATDVWLPHMMTRALSPGWNPQSRNSTVDLIGRLKPGVTLEQAQTAMNVLASQLEASYPETNRDSRILIHTLAGGHPRLRSRKAELPRLLLVSVSCLLLIGCVNLAGLLLAQGAARQKEIAMRLALGASRGRVIRQLLTESVLLALVGGVAGWVAAHQVSGFLTRYYFPEIDGARPSYTLSFDGSLFFFSLSVALLTAMVFGLVPSLQASRLGLVSALRDDSSAFGYRRSHLRAAFLVVQVALSMVLLIGAALMVQSVRNLSSDAGFDTTNVAFFRMRPQLSGYTRPQAHAYFRQVQERLQSLPEVRGVTFGSSPPLRDWSGEGRVGLPGERATSPTDVRRVKQNKVAPGFFEALQIPILRGRSFIEQDVNKGQRSAIVNQILAQQLWPDRDAVGETIVVDDEPYAVVGVTSYDSFKRTDEPSQPFLFRAEFGGSRMLVRLRSDPGATLPLLRREILAVDPNVVISEQMAMAEMVQNFFAPGRTAMVVLVFAGALALLLSAIGLYGILSLTVSQRRREVGIRMALGADPGSVVRLILKSGLRLTFLGLILGLILAFLLTRFLSGYLYGIGQNDPLTFIVSAALLMAVASLACWLPARRATKIDPMIALRSE